MGKDKDGTGKQHGETERERSKRLEKLAAKTGKSFDRVVDEDNEKRQQNR